MVFDLIVPSWINLVCYLNEQPINKTHVLPEIYSDSIKFMYFITLPHIINACICWTHNGMFPYVASCLYLWAVTLSLASWLLFPISSSMNPFFSRTWILYLIGVNTTLLQSYSFLLNAVPLIQFINRSRNFFCVMQAAVHHKQDNHKDLGVLFSSDHCVLSTTPFPYLFHACSRSQEETIFVFFCIVTLQC